MHPYKRISKIVVGGILLAAAVFGLLAVRHEAGLKPSHVIAPASAARVPESGVAPAAAVPVTTAAMQQPPALSRPAPVVPAAVRQLLPSVDRVVTNWKEFKPEKITIAPYPDMPIEFEVTSIREERGRTVWTGRNSIQGAFLVAAATEDEWHATLVIPAGGTFEANILGSAVTMLAKEDGNNLCGTQPTMARQVSAAATSPEEEITGVVAAPDVVTNTVDVLFFYDADTLANVQGNTSTIETRLISYIASSNAALDNSQVTNFRWRYLTAYQVPAYEATNDMANDLNVITGVVQNPNGSYRTVSNPVSIFLQQKAALHGADQVVLYVGGNRNFAGIAWISPSTLAFHTAVVAWPNSPGNPGSFFTVAHEMGHGFGCFHDRQTEGASDGDGQYHYGFRFPDRFGRDTGTIMSYATRVVPYYSNPAVTYSDPAFVVTGIALGVPEGQPKAANNSRVLRDNAQLMIDSRPAVDPPLIVAQPQPVTVTVGQGFSLAVAAVANAILVTPAGPMPNGGPLVYQWKLAGADIAGATDASYSKSAASASDAGSYTVTVSNAAGPTVSTAAIVTVNPAAPASPAAPTAPSGGGVGGGGGGGGAIDSWFAAGCGLLVMVRCILKKPAS